MLALRVLRAEHLVNLPRLVAILCEKAARRQFVRRLVLHHVRIPDPNFQPVLVRNLAGVLQDVERLVFHDRRGRIVVGARRQKLNRAGAEQRKVADILLIRLFRPRRVGVGLIAVADLAAAQFFPRIGRTGAVAHGETTLVPIGLAQQPADAVDQTGPVEPRDRHRAVLRRIGVALRRGRRVPRDAQLNRALSGSNQRKRHASSAEQLLLEQLGRKGRGLTAAVESDGIAPHFRCLHVFSNPLSSQIECLSAYAPPAVAAPAKLRHILSTR